MTRSGPRPVVNSYRRMLASATRVPSQEAAISLGVPDTSQPFGGQARGLGRHPKHRRGGRLVGDRACRRRSPPGRGTYAGCRWLRPSDRKQQGGVAGDESKGGRRQPNVVTTAKLLSLLPCGLPRRDRTRRRSCTDTRIPEWLGSSTGLGPAQGDAAVARNGGEHGRGGRNAPAASP